jgi:salicylate hydroxylase
MDRASACARIRRAHRVNRFDRADGLWSNVRALVADGPPRVSGHTTYRSVIPTDRSLRIALECRDLVGGSKCHLVHYPLSGMESL